jgi:deoxyribodipyrimidine photo-lyase
VESDVIVPVDTAADGEQYSAATLRRRLTPQLPRFLLPCDATTSPKNRSPVPEADASVLRDIDGLMDRLEIADDPGPVPPFAGGLRAARTELGRFIKRDLAVYDTDRNDPAEDHGSNMSPYLHFGQISPVEVALRVRGAPDIPPTARDAFLEELIVRRELSMNFVDRNPAYDRFDGLPGWARQTLADHARDPRPAIYSQGRLEAGETADPYWNAAQKEMVARGKMHGYMRMYWGKKVLEWSPSPEAAFDTLLYLNNKYELDGRDANGFAGIAWCFGKHDRGWPERPVFGKVRYMNDAGLRRKFRIDRYVERIAALGNGSEP